MSKEQSQIELYESQVLEEWKKKNEDPLPLKTSMDLYALYLEGYTLEDIYFIHDQTIPYGQIIDAKERYEWDKRKKRQLTAIFKKVEDRVIKTKSDAVFYLTDALSVAHKQMGERMKLFLKTGNSEALGTMDFTNIKVYKSLLEMLELLTEPKVEKKDVMVGGTVNHEHQHQVKISSKKAASLLGSIDSIVDVEPNE